MKNRLPLLKIDPELSSLKQPLSKEEYNKLVKSIIEKGCLEPISVWREFIIDGHKRYNICHEYDIPFETTEISLKSKEDAISLICSETLKDKDLPETIRRYLIGKKYDAEKTVGIMNITGVNQHTIDSLKRKPHEGKTALKIANEYHVSSSTVHKYLQFARAIDRFKTESPVFAESFLSDNIKISQDNLIELAKLPSDKLKSILNRAAIRSCLSGEDVNALILESKSLSNLNKPKNTVKDMPVYDPDAYVASLVFTIPSWINTIKRTADNSSVDTLSKKAKHDLIEALDKLIYISSLTKKILEEE